MFEELAYIQQIADNDVQILNEKGKSYGDSWKRRGGVGAFMMLARKWDRLENSLGPAREAKTLASLGASLHKAIPTYDIFAAAELDEREEGILDDIGDLRRYLLLVEGEMRARLDDKKVRSNTATVRAGERMDAAKHDGAAVMERSQESSS